MLLATPSPSQQLVVEEEGKLEVEVDELHRLATPPTNQLVDNEEVPQHTPADISILSQEADAAEFDYGQACTNIDLDRSIPPVSRSSLRVVPSSYWCLREGVLVREVGDALVCTEDIIPGQFIARFVGVEISPEEAAALPDGMNNYLIAVSDDIVLNCETMAKMRPEPGCFASISNMAEGLQRDGVTLGYNDNNASADQSLDEQGRPIVELYSVRFIRRNIDEIMWSYGPEFDGVFDRSTTTSSDNEREVSDEEDEREGNTTASLSPEPQDPLAPHGLQARLQGVVHRLDQAGFGQDDAIPELAFNNISYEDDGSDDEQYHFVAGNPNYDEESELDGAA